MEQQPTVRNEPPSPERIAAAVARQDRLNLVTGGCGACCGAIDLRAGGSELACARLQREGEPDAFRTAAVQCPLPELYRQVHAGQRADLTEDEVQAVRPDFRGLRRAAAALPPAGETTDEATTDLEPAPAAAPGTDTGAPPEGS